MEFFNSAIEVLQTLVVALGAGLDVWGGVNLLEGYGSDNPGSPSQAADVAALRQKLTGQSAGAKAAAAGQVAGAANKPVRVGKIGRNDPCPCGSGLKWKKCTCQQYHPDLYAKK